MNFSDGAVFCQNGHLFDISREGYLNMLTSKKRFHKDIGDSKEMLLSRDRFLGHGYYHFLSDEVNKLVVKHLKRETANEDEDTTAIVEVGSGTSFYLGKLKGEMEKALPNSKFSYFGTDISKEAMKFSAKKYKDISFLVADTYSVLPFKNNCASVILNIFSPRNAREFKRVLKNNGLLLTVIPNADHMNEVIEKFKLIGIEEDKKENISAILDERFEKIEDQDCKQELLLSQDSVVDLVKMGPNYEYMDESFVQEIKNVDEMKVTVSFNVSLYKSN